MVSPLEAYRGANQAASKAINEAGSANLPGKENGPYDAYRHLLWSAEMTRLYGEEWARIYLEAHEIDGNIRQNQSPESEAMDRRNNEIGIGIGRDARSWDEIVERARRAIEDATSGPGGSATDPDNPNLVTWPDPSKWSGTGGDPAPRDKNGQPIPPDQWNWPTNPNNPNGPVWPDGPFPPPKGIPPSPTGNYNDPYPDPKPWSDSPMQGSRAKGQGASKIPSPIALDLNGDGINTIDVQNGVWFDHEGDGFAEKSGWVSSSDGLLIRDINGNGNIDSGKELFGSETLLLDGSKATNGFEALKELDANHDGVIDNTEANQNSLKVWKDNNSNGWVENGELLTFEEANIRSINTSYSSSTTIDQFGNEHRQIGGFTTITGENRSAEDVWFKADYLNSISTTWITVPDDIRELPDAKGYGKVEDLHQAMAKDASGQLKLEVGKFGIANSIIEREQIAQNIIYKWTGVESIDPNSRAASQIYGNAIGDARKLEALEEFWGEEWTGVWCWGTQDPNPHGKAAPVLLDAYHDVFEVVYAQLASQTYLKSIYDAIRY